jgi:hypothetical protein
MQQSGQIMHEYAHGSRQSYKRGCRCDLCKQAEREYKKDLRQRQREAVGEFVTPSVTLSLVSGSGSDFKSHPVSGSGAVESAVALEIDELGPHQRPGLAAGALAMARILDNPKAVSTQPAAAAKLAQILETLRRTSTATKPKLASVRQMTRSWPEVTSE